ncbi:MAG: response regulator transcription factor [Bacteroidetes bacterium]|nr:response regulator transcription factor [Bacteroidota bacterium]
MAKPITVFLADDHPVFTRGLAGILASDARFTLSGTAANGTEALERIRALRPTVAVLDVSMPGLSGLEIARSVLREGLRTRIIILTMFDDAAYLQEALDAGVMGYLLKDSIAVEILKCLAAVAEGKRFISPALTDHLLRPAEASPADRITLLTPTERKVLKLLSQNRTSAEIAERMHVSSRTVQNHRVNIAAKLGLTGYNKLLGFALEHKQRLDSLQ